MLEKVWRKKETPYTADGNVSWCNRYGEQAVWNFLKRLKIELLHNPTPGHISGENSNSKKCTHPECS